MVSLRPLAVRCNLCHLRMLSVQEHSYIDTDSKDIRSCDDEKLLCGLGASTLISSDYNMDFCMGIQSVVSV